MKSGPIGSATAGRPELDEDQDASAAGAGDRVWSGKMAADSSLVLFLASGRARNINGADYIIDGGQSKTA